MSLPPPDDDPLFPRARAPLDINATPPGDDDDNGLNLGETMPDAPPADDSLRLADEPLVLGDASFVTPHLGPAPASPLGMSGDSTAGLPAGFGPSTPNYFSPNTPAGGYSGAATSAATGAADGFAPTYGGYAPPSVPVAKDNDSTPTMLYVARGILVGILAMAVGLFCILTWVLLAGIASHGDVEDWSLTIGDQPAAAAQLADAQGKLDAMRTRLEETQKVEQAQEQAQPSATDVLKQVEQDLREIPGGHEPSLRFNISRLRTTWNKDKIPAYDAMIHDWLRGHMQSHKLTVERMAYAVIQLGNDETKAAFYETIKSADDVRRRYQITHNTPVVLLPYIPSSEMERALPMLLELSESTTEIERVLKEKNFAWNKHGRLAFHPRQAIQTLVRSHVSPDAMYAGAAEALAGDPEFAEQAALWLNQQTPDDAHRAKVLDALDPWVARRGFQNYTYAAAYARWSDQSRVARMLDLVESPARAEVLADAVRVLAAAKDPRLDSIVKANIGDADWFERLAPFVKDDAIAAAVVQALADVNPDGRHQPLIVAWGERPGKEDTAWLVAYAEKMPAQLRRGPYYASLQSIITKKSGASP